MAGTKETKKSVSVDEIDYENISLDTKVTVRNLAGWELGFAKRHEVGDCTFARGASQRISRNEIQAQVNDGNKAFLGIDGAGSHATFYIEDELTRKWLGFETDDNEQNILTDNKIKYLFDGKVSQSKFEKLLPEYVVTRAEKYALIEAIDRLNLNDYRKIMYAIRYTGYKPENYK